ncbi:MAG: dihydroorotase [Planctomycetes bacterium]|nr:dihydroorotase [Planctomycetota bacterium]
MIEILIKNGRLIDPANNRDEKCDLAVTGGKVAKIARGIKGKAGRTIDADGLIVSPGLIDAHVHCREPGHEEEETIASAAAAAVAGGFTTICAMPNTHPPIDDETAVNYVISRGQKAGLARVLPVGCITSRREGKELAEMGMMKSAGAVAFSDDGDGVACSGVMLKALQYARMLDVPIMQHCQDADLAGGSMNAGPVAVRLGLGGMAAAGEQIMLRRDLELVERTKARYHVLHVSSAGSVDLIRQAKALGLPVTAEATPHHLLLTDEACATYDSNYKMNPPLRSASDMQALRNGLADGAIDSLASDHAPHTEEEKELEFGVAPFGIISLECALGLYIKALIDSGALDWPGLIRCMTAGPAKTIASGRPGLGSLSVGADADITIIDPDARWTVDANSFASLSRNCPYHGWKLKGRAVVTVVAGQIKHSLL